MVGIVIVSHSKKLVEGMLHELRVFSKLCPIALAGGDENDNYGTSINKIKKAIKDVYSEDGVCIITDLGSSIMTSEIVLEELNDRKIQLLDCSFLEGSISAVILSEQGKTIDEIVYSIKQLPHKTPSNS